jgi:ArsR family transcriptional regulator
MNDLATLFKALGDETRLHMVALLLRHGELCVCDLEHTLGVTQSKASRHLRYLKAAGLLEDRRGAQWVFYRITRQSGRAQKLIISALRRLLQGAEFDRLDRRLVQWRASKQAAGERCHAPVPVRRHRGLRTGASV